VRYVGQGHELDVEIGDSSDPGGTATLFEALHEQLFGYTLDREVEIVSLRHAASGASRSVRLQREDALPPSVTGPASLALPDATMFVAGGWKATPLEIGGWMLERDAR
jgi:N-methylhydantoinase A